MAGAGASLPSGPEVQSNPHFNQGSCHAREQVQTSDKAQWCVASVQVTAHVPWRALPVCMSDSSPESLIWQKARTGQSGSNWTLVRGCGRGLIS